MRISRRAFAPLALMSFVLFFASRARADVNVPVSLQAQLVRRLAPFDRNFVARAGGTARVLVVHKSNDAESKSVSGAFVKGLAELHDVAGLPVEIAEMPFTGAAALAERCRRDKIALVYVSVGLGPELPQLAAALASVDVMTVGASAQHAEKGTVVGFDLEEGRPKIVLHLSRAKAQRVSFRADVLKLARIIE